MEDFMDNTAALSESLEDYLETILELQTRNTVARSKDIAEKLDIKRGSVTGMLKKLAAQDLINYEPYGFVTLTPQGEKIAKEIENRHMVLKDFLFRIIQVDEETAEQTACQMEHAMDKETLARLKRLIAKVDACPNCRVSG